MSTFAYTGKFFEAYTALQNNWHRWYDASTGRWVSEDPIGFGGGDANKYRYVGNMATTYVDFNALEWYKPWTWGQDIGTRIGEAYAEVYIADYGQTYEAARLNQERIIRDLSVINKVSECPDISVSDFGQERNRNISQGVGEAIDGASTISDGILAAGELGLTVVGVIEGGIVVKDAANGIFYRWIRSTSGKWSREALSLQDQLTLEAARKGHGEVIIDCLNDPAYKGMQKMEYKVKSIDGRDSVVHYVRDPSTGNFYDFKFTKHSTEGLGNWANKPDIPDPPTKQ